MIVCLCLMFGVKEKHIYLIYFFHVLTTIAKEHSVEEISIKCPFYLKRLCSVSVYFPKRAGGSNILFNQRESPEFLLHHSWQPHISITGEAGCLIEMNESSQPILFSTTAHLLVK